MKILVVDENCSECGGDGRERVELTIPIGDDEEQTVTWDALCTCVRAVEMVAERRTNYFESGLTSVAYYPLVEKL